MKIGGAGSRAEAGVSMVVQGRQLVGSGPFLRVFRLLTPHWGEHED